MAGQLERSRAVSFYTVALNTQILDVGTAPQVCNNATNVSLPNWLIMYDDEPPEGWKLVGRLKAEIDVEEGECLEARETCFHQSDGVEVAITQYQRNESAGDGG